MIYSYMNRGLVRRFNLNEIGGIDILNFSVKNLNVYSFIDWFDKGYNSLYPEITVEVLSYLYDKFDLVDARFTKIDNNTHYLIEYNDYLIDPSLMLIFYKQVLTVFGYDEISRINYKDIMKNKNYLRKRNNSFTENDVKKI